MRGMVEGLNVSAGQISRIETGMVRYVNIETLEEIAKGLGCHVSDLIESGMILPHGNLNISQEELSMVDLFRALPATTRHQLHLFLASLASAMREEV